MSLDPRGAARLVAGTSPAEQAFRVALLLTVPVYWWVGRHQWFIRDDWAFLITRPRMRELEGAASWLLTAQDGHWMTPPLLVYRLIQNLFGIESYWPYLVPTMALHVTAVCLVRVLCRRAGASPWTTTILTAMLLVFGGGWEDILFAIQIVYNLSLVAFLGHVLLVDHDGPPDRRDAWGALLGIVSITSSGFGPFFLFGVGALLALRRRWRALAIAVLPQGLLYAWWWLTWGEDPVGASTPHSLTGPFRYARLGLTATLNSLTGQVLFAGAAFLGIVAMCVWVRLGWDRRSTFLALCGTVAVMFLGIGYQRASLGLGSAASSRYQHMAAVLLVPVLALAVDQLRRFDRRALVVGQLLLLLALVQNVRLLRAEGDAWADRAHGARRLFALVAADPRSATADPRLHISDFNPDVTIGALAYLRDAGWLDPAPTPTAQELALVDGVFGGFPVQDNAP